MVHINSITHHFTTHKTNYSQFPAKGHKMFKSRTQLIPGQVSEIKDCPEKFRMDGHVGWLGFNGTFYTSNIRLQHSASSHKMTYDMSSGTLTTLSTSLDCTLTSHLLTRPEDGRIQI